jgi:hypothetical protein
MGTVMQNENKRDTRFPISIGMLAPVLFRVTSPNKPYSSPGNIKNEKVIYYGSEKTNS